MERMNISKYSSRFSLYSNPHVYYMAVGENGVRRNDQSNVGAFRNYLCFAESLDLI